MYCVSSVPIVVLLIAGKKQTPRFIILFDSNYIFLVCVYGSHYNKSIEMSNMHVPICFVAEVYEPFTLRLNKKEIEYSAMTQDEIKDNQEVRSMKRKVVGTIAIKNHNSLHDSAWLYRLAVDPKYPFNRVAKSLVEAAMRHAFDHHMFTCETVSMECHEDFREVLLKIG